MRRREFVGLLGGTVATWPFAAQAEKNYDPGVSDTEIRVGNTMPYSGPSSAFGLVGQTIVAYFKKLDDDGGINGRKINFISYDDGYSPAKTVEQVRRLVEHDEVLLIFSSLGTPTNNAIRKYLNAKHVPQLFAFTGASEFGDPTHFPWTMGWQPTYQSEGRVYAKYLLEREPRGKIGILSQNDDFGKDFVAGLKDGLNGQLPIVRETVYELTDPTIDSQIVALKTSGADIFLNASTPKFAAQAIRRMAETGWKAVHLLVRPSNSVGSVLKPAGLANAKGILSVGYSKDPTDPDWIEDAGVKEWTAFMDRYFPDGDRNSSYPVLGYCVAQTFVQVVRQCGDDLTRANVMKQAANLKNLQIAMLLPGITVNTSTEDYNPIKQMQMMRFDGERWERFGPIIGDRQ